MSPYGRLLRAPRGEVAGAIDCARCRSLVEQHAPTVVDLQGPRLADLGTAAGYAIDKHYGVSDPSGALSKCPDCGRVTRVEERQNVCWTLMPLDRDVAGR